ncbi:ROK family protein [Populibacterium corticicola]|uniref:ROK family protein n=1 Tax=Populibacterium corticicola TaxID=1812826 RepID=A0ABW5XJU7_9MICO
MSISEHPMPLTGHARAIVKSLLLNGPQSRSDLAATLELSPGSLTRLSRPLIDTGYIIEHPTLDQPTGIGRPSVPLNFNHDRFRFIGVKLTKTHAYAALTLADSRIEHLITRTLDIPTVDNAVATITELVEELTAKSPVPIHALGVALGAHVANYRTITHADHLGWDEVPLSELLEQSTGLPTYVENDIVAHTESTHWFGEGRETDDFALFTLGAGIGYGLVTHGQAVTSPEAGYSLLSHFPLRTEGLSSRMEHLATLTGVPNTKLLRVECGHEACATAMLTLGALEQRASKLLGRTVTFSQLIGLAQAGDPVASAIADASGYALGTLLAAITNLTMPTRIVLGGEAVLLAEVAATSMHDGLHDNRDPRSTDPELRLQNPDLALWTQGAAVVAVHTSLVGRT